MDIIRTIHQGTPEMKYYDKVVTLLREKSITTNPDWNTVMDDMKENKTPEESAFEFVAEWDVD